MHRNSLTAERRRTLTLHELRPLTLIGESKPLLDWSKVRIDDLNSVDSKVRQFYANQNELINDLQLVDQILDSGLHQTLISEYSDDIGEETPRQRQPVPQTLISPTETELDSDSKTVKFWINLNMFVNVILLVAKFAVYKMTNSISIGASLVDSLLDLLSTLIIFISAFFAQEKTDEVKHLYPVGRFRLEPIGILVFSVVMIVSFVKVAEDAVQRLITMDLELPVITVPSLVVMLMTLLVKGLIYLLCKHVKNSSVRALSLDALTDCYFNFFSMLFPLFSTLLMQPNIDPLGALVLSLYVVYSWGQTALEHINNLTGAACTPNERQQLLYMCVRFSERIKYITALNAYHAGDRLLCEVDVLLDQGLCMRDCHDLAEALQYALETLPIVERAFVHIDYRRGNFTGHVL